MFSDPQSVTYATVAKSLAAVSRGVDSSSYKLNDSGTVFDLTLSRQFKPTRTRSVSRFTRTVYASDPVVPTNFVLASGTCTITLDFPVIGFTAVDAQNLGKALRDWATDANLLKMANGET